MVREDAPFFGRACSYCYPGWRKTSYSCSFVNQQEDQQQVKIEENSDLDLVYIRHEKGWSCPINALIGCDDNGPIRVPCCCFLPYLHTYDNRTNTKLGTSRVICNCEPLCCPKFAVYDAEDNPKYLIRPDLCCFNCCYVCPKCERGAKCCYVPFYIRDYHTKEKIDPDDNDVALIDLYIGLKHECCTMKNLYSVKFPSNANNSDKATLVGAALLYDITMNEQAYDGQC